MVEVKPFCGIVDLAGSAFSVQVDESDSVTDLKKAIKEASENITAPAKKLQLYLAKKADGEWLLKESSVAQKLADGVTEPDVTKMVTDNKMRSSWTIREVLDAFKMTGERAPSSEQVHVLVVVSGQQGAASIKKPRRHKGMSAEASSEKVLDAVAQKLANLYDFDFRHGDFPTIGDVFDAIRSNDWEFRLKRGRPLTDVELPNYFAKEEWEALEELHERTYRRLHDGNIPTTSEGKPYLILPHAIFTGDQVNELKDIATKANLVGEPSELEVHDEDESSKKH
jgi:hypothetical protein